MSHINFVAQAICTATVEAFTVGEAVHQSLATASNLGFGKKYVPSLVKAQEKLTGAKFTPSMAFNMGNRLKS